MHVRAEMRASAIIGYTTVSGLRFVHRAAAQTAVGRREAEHTTSSPRRSILALPTPFAADDHHVPQSRSVPAARGRLSASAGGKQAASKRQAPPGETSEPATHAPTTMLHWDWRQCLHCRAPADRPFQRVLPSQETYRFAEQGLPGERPGTRLARVLLVFRCYRLGRSTLGCWADRHDRACSMVSELPVRCRERGPRRLRGHILDSRRQHALADSCAEL